VLYFLHMKTISLRSFIATTRVLICVLAFSVYASQTSGDATSSSGSTEYRNSNFGFSIAFPADLTVTESVRCQCIGGSGLYR
jgi:hypothetical protein